MEDAHRRNFEIQNHIGGNQIERLNKKKKEEMNKIQLNNIPYQIGISTSALISINIFYQRTGFKPHLCLSSSSILFKHFKPMLRTSVLKFEYTCLEKLEEQVLPLI